MFFSTNALSSSSLPPTEQALQRLRDMATDNQDVVYRDYQAFLQACRAASPTPLTEAEIWQSSQELLDVFNEMTMAPLDITHGDASMSDDDRGADETTCSQSIMDVGAVFLDMVGETEEIPEDLCHLIMIVQVVDPQRLTDDPTIFWEKAEPENQVIWLVYLMPNQDKMLYCGLTRPM